MSLCHERAIACPTPSASFDRDTPLIEAKTVKRQSNGESDEMNYLSSSSNCLCLLLGWTRTLSSPPQVTTSGWWPLQSVLETKLTAQGSTESATFASQESSCVFARPIHIMRSSRSQTSPKQTQNAACCGEEYGTINGLLMDDWRRCLDLALITLGIM